MNVSSFITTHQLIFTLGEQNLFLRRNGTGKSYIVCNFKEKDSKILCEVKNVSQPFSHDIIQISLHEIVCLMRKMQQKYAKKSIPINIDNCLYFVHDFYVDGRDNLFAFITSDSCFFAPILIPQRAIIVFLNEYITN